MAIFVRGSNTPRRTFMSPFVFGMGQVLPDVDPEVEAMQDGGFVNVREHIPALDELELDEVRKELAESQQRELDELRKELAELRQPRCRRFRFFK